MVNDKSHRSGISKSTGYENRSRIFAVCAALRLYFAKNHQEESRPDAANKYDLIGDYRVKDYKERPHEYAQDKK